MFFRKKLMCEHEWECVGMYYKEHLTEYRNCFDRVVVYKRYICSVCDKIYDEELSCESFVPEMHYRYDARRKEYIRKLQDKGIYDEIDFITGSITV